jgi:dTDP-glucose 4,6-dehydratase
MSPSNPLPPVCSTDLELIAKRTAPGVWTALHRKRLFITGGTGFVGCWLLEALLFANRRFQLELTITVLTRNPVGFSDKAPHLANDAAVTLARGDMRELNGICGPFDAVIHAATDVAAQVPSALAAFDAIVGGTHEALKLAGRSGARRFLYLSSGAVYGRCPADLPRIPESYQGAPSIEDGSPYAHGKRASEWLVRAFCKEGGIEPVTARLFALIGPYLPLDGHFAASQFFRDALAGSPPTVNGGERTVRSYLYGADLAIWLLTILAQGEPFQCYNVGSEEAVTIGTLARRIAGLCLDDSQVRTQSDAGAVGLAGDRYVPDTAKARETLALREYTVLDQALATTIDWFRISSPSS